MKLGLSKETYFRNAQIYKVLGNPKRLEILNLLKYGEMGVEQILKITKISKANLSQHFGVLKKSGLIKNRRQGLNIFYTIVSPKIVDTCRLLQDLRDKKIIK
ncbi:MAG: metalloregulator ArsR/SmtB family transcription factor [Candidatus Paceibacterota bacterium]